MWNYEKRLQFPVNITRPNAKIAQIIISQYGGRWRQSFRGGLIPPSNIRQQSRYFIIWHTIPL